MLIFAAMNKQLHTEYLSCPIRHVIDRFGDKWSLLVLYALWRSEGGVMRFGELRRFMDDCSQKMLSQTLKSLVGNHLVSRKQYPEIPPRVDYSLTPLGRSLMPHVEGLIGWSLEHFVDVTDGKVIVK